MLAGIPCSIRIRPSTCVATPSTSRPFSSPSTAMPSTRRLLYSARCRQAQMPCLICFPSPSKLLASFVLRTLWCSYMELSPACLAGRLQRGRASAEAPGHHRGIRLPQHWLGAGVPSISSTHLCSVCWALLPEKYDLGPPPASHHSRPPPSRPRRSSSLCHARPSISVPTSS